MARRPQLKETFDSVRDPRTGIQALDVSLLKNELEQVEARAGKILTRDAIARAEDAAAAEAQANPGKLLQRKVGFFSAEAAEAYNQTANRIVTLNLVNTAEAHLKRVQLEAETKVDVDGVVRSDPEYFKRNAESFTKRMVEGVHNDPKMAPIANLVEASMSKLSAEMYQNTLARRIALDRSELVEKANNNYRVFTRNLFDQGRESLGVQPLSVYEADPSNGGNKDLAGLEYTQALKSKVKQRLGPDLTRAINELEESAPLMFGNLKSAEVVGAQVQRDREEIVRNYFYRAARDARNDDGAMNIILEKLDDGSQYHINQETADRLKKDIQGDRMSTERWVAMSQNMDATNAPVGAPQIGVDGFSVDMGEGRIGTERISMRWDRNGGFLKFEAPTLKDLPLEISNDAKAFDKWMRQHNSLKAKLAISGAFYYGDAKTVNRMKDIVQKGDYRELFDTSTDEFRGLSTSGALSVKNLRNYFDDLHDEWTLNKNSGNKTNIVFTRNDAMPTTSSVFTSVNDDWERVSNEREALDFKASGGAIYDNDPAKWRHDYTAAKIASAMEGNRRLAMKQLPGEDPNTFDLWSDYDAEEFVQTLDAVLAGDGGLASGVRFVEATVSAFEILGVSPEAAVAKMTNRMVQGKTPSGNKRNSSTALLLTSLSAAGAADTLSDIGDLMQQPIDISKFDTQIVNSNITTLLDSDAYKSVAQALSMGTNLEAGIEEFAKELYKKNLTRKGDEDIALSMTGAIFSKMESQLSIEKLGNGRKVVVPSQIPRWLAVSPEEIGTFMRQTTSAAPWQRNLMSGRDSTLTWDFNATQGTMTLIDTQTLRPVRYSVHSPGKSPEFDVMSRTDAAKAGIIRPRPPEAGMPVVMDIKRDVGMSPRNMPPGVVPPHPAHINVDEPALDFDTHVKGSRALEEDPLSRQLDTAGPPTDNTDFKPEKRGELPE